MELAKNQMSRKYSKSFERDYNFYMNCINNKWFSFSGTDIKKNFNILFDSKAINAKSWFHKYDSSGKIGPCSEPDLIYQLLAVKAGVNFQIKQWAEGRSDFSLSYYELMEYMNYYSAPEWLIEAVENQAKRIIKNSSLDFKKESFKELIIETNLWHIKNSNNKHIKFTCEICNAEYFSIETNSYGLPLVPQQLISYKRSNNEFALRCSKCNKEHA